VTGLALLHQECRPGVGAPSHTHLFEEVLTIVSGTAEVWVDDRRCVVGPGTTVFVRTGAVHGFTNVGDEPLQLQAIIAATELRAMFLEPPDNP
jgi:mannose-6-phosphate isomerase-like protein (cupin superfamily)